MTEQEVAEAESLASESRRSRRRRKKHTRKNRKRENLIYNLKWMLGGLAAGLPVLVGLIWLASNF